ncbi:diol dehydratase small subunit, partial [Cetobacterium sp. ZWU0022]|uniref:diol dehydratase small subunit n=1 Tax=Cetobacterium sp. ZWU0022 TaxID=1340502 RepID=UPI000645D70D
LSVAFLSCISAVFLYYHKQPYKSTKDELLSLAHELDFLYGASENANFIRSLIQTYEKKGFFKKDFE